MEFASKSHTMGEDLKVEVIREVFGVNDGLGKGIGGGDVDCSGRKGVHKADEDRVVVGTCSRYLARCGEESRICDDPKWKIKSVGDAIEGNFFAK